MPPEAKLADVFDGLGRAMLILGAPGSGKTTTMRELLRELLASAQQDGGMSIPVVLPLASWALRRQPLAQWIPRAVTEKYGVASRHVRAWLEDEELVLLLDGLDEVAAKHREDCVEAISTFRREYGTMDMVICCRTREYELLQVPPALYGRLTIEPLNRQQIDQFLNHPEGRLAGARAAFIQEPALWDLVDTPLILSILINTFGEAAPSGNLGGSNPQELLNMLFAGYVPAMLHHRVDASRPPLATIRSLAFLARQLERVEQTTFSSDLLDTHSLPERWWGTALGLANSLLIKAISVLGMGASAMIFYSWPGAIAGGITGMLSSLEGNVRVGSTDLASQARHRRDQEAESPDEFFPEEKYRELAEILMSIFSKEELAKLATLLREEFPEADFPKVLSEEGIADALIRLPPGKLSADKLDNLTMKLAPGQEVARRLKRYERRSRNLDDYEPHVLGEFDEEVAGIMQVQDRRWRVRFLQSCLRAARQGVVIFEWWRHFRERMRDEFYYVGDLSVAGLLIVLLAGAVTGILLGWPYAAAATISGIVTLVLMTIIDKFVFRLPRRSLAWGFPSPGVRATMRIGLPVALSIGLLAGGLADLLVTWMVNIREGLQFGIVTAACVTLFSAICLGGGALLEQTRIRLILHWADLLPMRSRSFLGQAEQYLFLQHTNESYQFAHRSMQGFFSGLCPVEEPFYSYRNEPDHGLVKMLVPAESRCSGGEADAELRSAPLPEELLSAAALAVTRAWYTKAAEGGNVDAQYNLGVLAEQLDPPDLASASTWLTQAAQARHIAAQYALGTLLLTRQDPPDLAAARTWLTRAAEAEDVRAQCSLGELLEQRLDPPDLAGARTWYMRAAKAGHAAAQYNLGMLLATQPGPDINQARIWLERAAEAGDRKARDALERLGGA